MTDEYAAGASAARNKLASHFRDNGIPVRPSLYGSPPTDADFVKAILSATSDEGSQFSPGKVMVLFKWWLSDIQIILADAIIKELERGARRRHHLFTAKSQGGWNTIYLARAADGAVKVHRKKHWRKDVELVDNSLVYPE